MKIGFIGLGAMGRGMAANLQRAGHDLVVHDAVAAATQEFVERGAVLVDSPQDVAAAANLVFTSLPTPADVEEVGFGERGLANALQSGSAWFDLSTNSVDVVRRLHGRLAGHGVHFLDAPVSGGPKGAASGQLAIWVGGERDQFDAFQDVLSAMSDDARYIGSIGAGTIAKLTHNIASIGINTVVTEALTMGVKAGVDPIALWEAIRSGGAGRQRAFDNVGRRFLQAKFDPPSFALRLAFKDAQLAMQLARDAGVPMMLCSLATAEMSEAMNRGWGSLDSQSFLRLQQERAGLPLFELSEQDVQTVMAEGDRTLPPIGNA
jgi:3-hydroxyisobutyrate dehydrogenase